MIGWKSEVGVHLNLVSMTRVKSYQDDGQVIMKASMQRSNIQS